MFSLEGKKALVVGVANDQSIAYGIARALRTQGADLAITYLNARAEPHVRPLAEDLGAELILPLDVAEDAQMDAVFAAIAERWGELDTLVHSIAFCPKEDCTAACSTPRARGSASPWTSRCIPSCAWCAAANR